MRPDATLSMIVRSGTSYSAIDAVGKTSRCDGVRELEAVFNSLDKYMCVWNKENLHHTYKHESFLLPL